MTGKVKIPHPFVDTRETYTYHRLNTMIRRGLRFNILIVCRILPSLRQQS